ncbi:antitoxin VapB family protein [Candidatus Woesearchaeota archaeon]|nr:antitoxin VapB family protein [Candidatus Woesearchaeota archaeon]
MVNINGSLKQEAYEFLKSRKANDQSFSDVVLEFKENTMAKKGSKEAILKFFGVLKDKGIDWEKKENQMKGFRDEFEARFQKKSDNRKSSDFPSCARFARQRSKAGWNGCIQSNAAGTKNTLVFSTIREVEESQLATMAIPGW